MPKFYKKLIDFWQSEESLSVFLWSLVVFIFILTPLFHLTAVPRVGIDLFWSVLLVTGIAAVTSAGRLRKTTITLVLISFFLGISVHFFDMPKEIEALGMLSRSGSLALFLYLIVKQTLRPGAITGRRVQGGIAVYLIIGLLWASFYTILYILFPNSFKGVDDQDSIESLIYLSFTTLTTLGLGDIVPVHNFARALLTAEALVGQLFPAIFIARLVTLQIDDKHKNLS